MWCICVCVCVMIRGRTAGNKMSVRVRRAYYGGATRGKPCHHRIQKLLPLCTPRTFFFFSRTSCPHDNTGRRSFHPDTESRTSRRTRGRTPAVRRRRLPDMIREVILLSGKLTYITNFILTHIIVIVSAYLPACPD